MLLIDRKLESYFWKCQILWEINEYEVRELSIGFNFIQDLWERFVIFKGYGPNISSRAK